MTAGHDEVRPLLAARPDELSGLQARWVAEHLATCQACTVEADTYRRLFRGLAAMVEVDLEPPAGLLERLLVTVGRRRSGAFMVAAAAGSAGALVATVVVARAVRQRRRAALARLAPSRRSLPRPAAIVAGDAGLVRALRWSRRLRLRATPA